jgi:hypothetical protein
MRTVLGNKVIDIFPYVRQDIYQSTANFVSCGELETEAVESLHHVHHTLVIQNANKKKSFLFFVARKGIEVNDFVASGSDRMETIVTIAAIGYTVVSF